jgi:hypothetical protein
LHSGYILHNFRNEIHLVLIYIFTLVGEGNLFPQGLFESLQIRRGPCHQLLDLLDHILKIIVLDECAFVVLVELLQVLLVDGEIDFGMEVLPNLGHVLLALLFFILGPLRKSVPVKADLGANHSHVVIELRNQGSEHALLAFSIKLLWVVDYFKYVFICTIYSTQL